MTRITLMQRQILDNAVMTPSVVAGAVWFDNMTEYINILKSVHDSLANRIVHVCIHFHYFIKIQAKHKIYVEHNMCLFCISYTWNWTSDKGALSNVYIRPDFIIVMHLQLLKMTHQLHTLERNYLNVCEANTQFTSSIGEWIRFLSREI